MTAIVYSMHQSSAFLNGMLYNFGSFKKKKITFFASKTIAQPKLG